MGDNFQFDIDRDGGLSILWEDGDHIFRRAWRELDDGTRIPVLAVSPALGYHTATRITRLTHECGLKDELDSAWAVTPLELLREGGRTSLILQHWDGTPLTRLLGAPMELPNFLRLAIAIVGVVGEIHRQGLVHKDVRPANILVNAASGEVRFTGFGIASRLQRERQVPAPPEFIAGTLPYMAPEQTGRMNRSIDSRSDLYSLGITFYRMLTGALPFTASDPMEWVHCHIARTPVPPHERLGTVPAPVSRLVMKLLAKTAEERYQTAAGVEQDLRRCRADWEMRGRIDEFQLAEHDVPDRLLIPEKLYGRSHEVAALLSSFHRVVVAGMPELILVSGYSGIGKSSVVNELHKVLVPPRGLFASGKFDQYKRDIPYATLAQAFQSLVRQILSKSEAELQIWREALREALGSNGLLMVGLIPELELIIGKPPPIADLLPQDAQRRFQTVLRRFIGVFARPEHPLALFLDDLQWLDAATLDLLEDLLTQQDIKHLLLIGAYRDNEVDAAHPLMRRLDAIRRAGATVQNIVLAPLSDGDLGQLIADSLRCRPKRARPLVQLVQEKTGGNPFFSIQFLYALRDEALLIFDHAEGRWSWDLDRIDAKHYTDNVVDLMVAKLTRLPAETRKALEQLACLGNIAEIATLSIILGISEEHVHTALWEAMRLELIERVPGAYRFIHDRVQEAAYALIPEDLRAAAHLRIGRLLVAHMPPQRREEAIFEIVNQLNRCTALITDRDERERLAALNLIAGQRAKASIAYASALGYVVAGASLLAEDCWERRHDLGFEIELNRAECEILTGAVAQAEQRLAALSSRTENIVEKATVACLRADLYVTLDRSSGAIAVGLDYLRDLGIAWSPHPTEVEARREYERIWSQLGSRTIEELIDLPLMTDPASLATLDVLTKIAVPAYYTDANLLALVACRAINLSLERGNCDGSCFAYEWLGLVAGARFGDYRAAYRFGQLGYDLVEKRGLKRYQARTYNNFAIHVLPWAKHVKKFRSMLRRAFDAANMIGDLTFVAHSCANLNTNMLVEGEPLGEVEREAEHGLVLAQRARFGFGVDLIGAQLGLVRTLRGLTPKFGSFDDAQFDESQIEHRFSENRDLAFAECWYWIRKLQARFFAGDYPAAVEAASRARHLPWTSLTKFLETADYHFYGALSLAAVHDSTLPDHRQPQLVALIAHHRELEIWAEHCPENFENRAALVGAELARLDGRELDAERLYEQAIRSSRANGFVHNEALTCEIAARFFAARGLEDFAEMYLVRARDGYRRWGADGKVRQLEVRYPQLAKADPRGETREASSPDHQLDVAAVVQASQALSSEILLPRLIERLMTIALQSAGADRGLLVLPDPNDYRIEAEARADGEGVALQYGASEGPAVPETLIRYVMRTQESVILDDAAKPHLFSEDPYLALRRPRSILCLPLVRQGALSGLLYLENTLASHVFTRERAKLLELLASQAGISLENASLYTDLQRNEVFLSQGQQISQTGSFGWNAASKELYWSHGLYSILEYDRSVKASYDLTMNRTHPDDRALFRRVFDDTMIDIKDYDVEHRLLMPDGRVKHVHVIGRAVHTGNLDLVGAVRDITERKWAEELARERERQYRESQIELEHANRVATMGQLSASIAHEVNQPIAATLINAATAQRFLARTPPDVDRSLQAIGRIISDGNRAAEIIDRIRALVKKAPVRKDDVKINEPILDVIALTQVELSDNGIHLRIQLAEGLPVIRGDRVQIQQVILNLIMNAVQAMDQISPDRRELLVSTQMESDCVLVAVRDSGPGLSEAALDRAFDAFYTTKPTGLGMGLSICRSIIEAHGGRLWGTANVPKGAAFQFMLPVDLGP